MELEYVLFGNRNTVEYRDKVKLPVVVEWRMFLKRYIDDSGRNLMLAVF